MKTDIRFVFLLCAAVTSSVEPVNRSWETSGLPLLRYLGFAPRRILDVGAYVGDWTRIHMRLFRNARFMMVDGSDHRRHWRDLLRSRRVDAEVAVLDKAVRKVRWFGINGTGDSMRMEKTLAYSDILGKLKQARTLDGLLQRRRWDTFRVELVKLDVQGSELDVLRGAPKVLRDAEVVLMEVPFAGSYNKGAPGFLRHLSFMDAAGFAPWDISELHRLNDHGDFTGTGHLIQIDILFLRKGSRFWHSVQEAISTVGRGTSVRRSAIRH